MGILKKITNRVLGKSEESAEAKKHKAELLRRCYFEVMEQRRVLSADPVIVGVTYLETDAGQDTTPDHFEVTFQGGAATTQLTQFVINGDQDGSGNISPGDMIFDVDANSPGTGGFHPFQFDASRSVGITEDDIVSYEVSADGLMLTVNLKNFEAGDKFAFTIDVDEILFDRVDKIASGVEFERTLFSATFVDENYTFANKDFAIATTLGDGFDQTQRAGLFYDEYDDLLSAGANLAGTTLDLNADNANGQANRSAGAIDVYELVPKPVTISGTVYHDENADCFQDANESGIAGVHINLQMLNTSTGQYHSVASTTTDAHGNYEFGFDLNLQPGTYRLIQTQPAGFLNVGAVAGAVEGSSTGVVQNDAGGKPNVIADIHIPLGGTAATNYDFCEIKPVSLSGHVWHDANDDGVRDPGEEGIANVLIQVTRVGAHSGMAGDPFAATDPIFVRTDANGHYAIDLLPPGVYEIVEINNYPPSEIDPLAAYLDGKDSVGNVAGTTVGVGTNDKFSQVVLAAGDDGVEYNFGEIKPAQIGGYVSLTTPEGSCLDPSHPNRISIEGVSIQLYDIDGNLVATTETNADGRYHFDSLRPGTYSIVQIQPSSYLSVAEKLGTVDGNTVGVKSENRFEAIALVSGSEGIMYNFCETLPAEISGTVYHDRNDNGVQDAGEEGIGGTVIELRDVNGSLISVTMTDFAGNYRFDGLYPGVYTVSEIQPFDFIDGKDALGVVTDLNGSNRTTGLMENDIFRNIELKAGDRGTEFNFGELKLGEIRGMVHADANGDCVFNLADGDKPLAGVTLELLNANGDVIATTLTDSNGAYVFSNLLPGEYSVRQIQPEGYFTQGQSVGDGGGTAAENLLSGIVISSDQKVTQYNFCEAEAAEISGRVWEDGPALVTEDGTLPDNYRDLFDGIFQQNVDTPISGVHMRLYYYIDPSLDEIAPRPVTLGEVQGEFYSHMGTSDPTAPVWVKTDANGMYSFKGLPAGNYIVLQTQPEGFVDANNSVGTTTGFTYNSASEAATASPFLQIFSSQQLMDAVINIRVNAGGISQLNNFTEINVMTVPPPPIVPPPILPPPVPPTPPIIPGNPLTPAPGMTGFPGLFGSQPSAFTQFIGNSRGASFQTLASGNDPYTWHLSVINGGQPRGEDDGLANSSVWHQAGFINATDWNRYEMNDAFWTFAETRGEDGEYVKSDRQARFGMFGGTPVAGDFDGDGIDEIAVFKDGYWMIDINRNGRWDEADLMVKLGDAGDRPVVGDWDGDGKDDIGIYGPEWEHDREAIARDPGLPNPENDPMTRPKNIPPSAADGAQGTRVMKLTSFGRGRVDEIDHVFGYGEEGLVPVAGDWNGNGIRSIGTFKDGVWQLDINGDGKFDSNDVTARFGQAGDIPLVGDFNGDGVDQIAVYRAGKWIIDSNGNREFDATDKVFEMGNAGDKPVVGDWNGDGVDQPGLYTEQRPVY